MKHAQVEPVTTPVSTFEVLVPVMITAIICAAVVMIVFIMIRGTESPDRPDTLRSLGHIVHELGEAGRKIIEAAARFFGGGPGGIA